MSHSTSTMNQYVVSGEFPANPWCSIWLRPKATIQKVVDSDPRRFVLVLAALGGFFETLNRASGRSLGDSLDFWSVLLFAVVVGGLGGIASLYIAGALVAWTGSWIGGKAPPNHIRAASAWGFVPFLWVSLLWIPELLLFGREMFTTDTPRLDSSDALIFAFIAMVAVQLVGGLWALVTYVKCVGQVQGFSAWKTLGNLIMAALIFVIPVALLIYAVP